MKSIRKHLSMQRSHYMHEKLCYKAILQAVLFRSKTIVKQERTCLACNFYNVGHGSALHVTVTWSAISQNVMRVMSNHAESYRRLNIVVTFSLSSFTQINNTSGSFLLFSSVEKRHRKRERTEEEISCGDDDVCERIPRNPHPWAHLPLSHLPFPFPLSSSTSLYPIGLSSQDTLSSLRMLF